MKRCERPSTPPSDARQLSDRPPNTDEPVSRSELLGDHTRDKVLELLRAYYPLPLTTFDLIDVLDIKAPTAWEHLRDLRAMGLVEVTTGGQYTAVMEVDDAGDS